LPAGDAQVRRQLGGSLNNLARLEMERGHPKRARQLLERALREQRAAVLALGQNRQALHFLANHYRVLVALLHQQGVAGAAADLCGQCLRDFEGRQSHFGGATGYFRFVARWRTNQGKLLRQAKRLDEAVRAFQSAVDAHGELADEPDDRGACARVLYALAGVRQQQCRLDAAVRLLRRAIVEQRAAHEADGRDWLRSYHTRLVDVLVEKKDGRAAAAVARELAGQAPADHADALLAARLLARCLPLAGAEATALRKELRGFVVEAVARCPAEAVARNDLAWELATAAEKELHDPPRAVALARLAVEARPNHGPFRHTLGAALYRNGELAAAVEALHESRRLRKGDAYEDLFLSLVYQRRGDGNLARQCYERARRWLAARKEVKEDLRRFEAEAREALGR
jgi:tetratricopeptide (TPR) repeat protein